MSLDISFDEVVEPGSAMPIEDTTGKTLTPLTFKVANNCGYNIDYEIGFVDVTDEDADELAYSSITMDLDNNLYVANTLSNSDYVYEDDEAATTKTLKYYTVEANEENEHEFRMWINNTSTVEEQQHEFEIKLFVRAGQGIVVSNIEIISGDLNTAGSEVRIGTEHFYVVGDDTAIEGNVKLLTKSPLLVGYNQNKFEELEEEYEEGNITEEEFYNEVFANETNTPGFNLQSYLTEFGHCDYKVYDSAANKYITINDKEYENAEDYFDYSEDELYEIYNSLTDEQKEDFFYECIGHLTFGSTYFSKAESYWVDEDDHFIEQYPSSQFENVIGGSDQNKETYIYDENSYLYEFIENYKDILEETYNIDIDYARLLSVDEFRELVPEDLDGQLEYVINNHLLWLYNSGYWLGNAYDKDVCVSYVDLPWKGIRCTTRGPISLRPIISVEKNLFD